MIIRQRHVADCGALIVASALSFDYWLAAPIVIGVYMIVRSIFVHRSDTNEIEKAVSCGLASYSKEEREKFNKQMADLYRTIYK